MHRRHHSCHDVHTPGKTCTFCNFRNTLCQLAVCCSAISVTYLKRHSNLKYWSSSVSPCSCSLCNFSPCSFSLCSSIIHDFVAFRSVGTWWVPFRLHIVRPYCISWFVASDQFRQLPLLCRRHKFKAQLRNTGAAPIWSKHAYACFVPCIDHFIRPYYVLMKVVFDGSSFRKTVHYETLRNTEPKCLPTPVSHWRLFHLVIALSSTTGSFQREKTKVSLWKQRVYNLFTLDSCLEDVGSGLISSLSLFNWPNFLRLKFLLLFS